MKKSDLVSVIIPVYNCQAYLQRCIDSILAQSYSNFEIIIIDDGSTDESGVISDKYQKEDKRIHVFHQENQGVSATRNLGIEKSNGEYITFVDSDDWLEVDFLKQMLQIAKKNKADYVTCGYNRVYSDHIETINNDDQEIIMSSNDYVLKLLNVQNGYGFVHMKLIRKNSIKKIRFRKELKVGEDALFNIELCLNLKKIVIYHKALYNYYLNTNSVVRKYDENYVGKYLKSMQYMNEYIKKQYPKNLEILKGLNNYIAYHVLLICVNHCYNPKNPEKGTKALKKVCQIELFGNAVKNSNYDNLSFTRKVSLFAIKHRLYKLMGCICQIRQKQFSRKK